MNDALDRFLREHFETEPDYAPYIESFLSEFLKLGPLHLFIPASLGGKFTGSTACMAMLDTVSYHSLPFGGGRFRGAGLRVSDEVTDPVREVLVCRDGMPQRRKVQSGKLVSWLLAQAVLEQHQRTRYGCG